ncbi:MAG: chorismate-binding protein [Bacteroidota bacterium]
MNISIPLTDKETFALYRLPNEKDHFLVSQEDGQYSLYDNHTFDQKGFVFYPFTRSSGKPSVFIKADTVLQNPVIRFHSTHQNLTHSISKTTYIHKVNQFIGATKARFKKLIFSRIKKIDTAPGNLFRLFEALKKSYPSAFVYLVNIANEGCWIGATPEILYTQKRVAKTMALAGTQVDLGLPLDEVQWGRKEIEEQSIVERYFQRILTNRGVHFRKSNRETVKAGNVLHLRTNFTFNPKGKVFELVSDLHPSPAVCGVPKHSAKDFIIKHEPHNRDYYCGFLGPVNLQGQTDLYVNLRCMQAMKDGFALYVGGGILPDSDPEKEWEETEMKAKTLSSVIEKVYLEEFV